MKLVVQRVLQAEVQVDGQSIGKINRGLFGVCRCREGRYKRNCG